MDRAHGFTYTGYTDSNPNGGRFTTVSDQSFFAGVNDAGQIVGWTTDGSGHGLLLSPAALTISPASQSASLGVTYDKNFSDTSPPANGSIAFTDTDTNTGNVSAKITNVDVTATDAKGNSVQLAAQQIGQLQAAISVGEVNSSQSNGVTSGSVGWNFSSGGLTTVAPGETAVVTSTVQVSDSDGHSDAATVAVTATGPTLPTNIIVGFDSKYMPTNMTAIKASTNSSAVGFYLPSAINYDAIHAPPGGDLGG